MLDRGDIGEILSVDFAWTLDTRHGADYFRRWHRNLGNSGSLLVHKATHHFDLVNWWLSSRPVEVLARGERQFYTPATADRMGLRRRTERCLTCPESKRCRFYLDLRKHEELARLYLANERHDGYFRDRCVWADDITIEDTMNVMVCYKSGATLSYSLQAYCPKEGMQIRFTGTRGQIEYQELETSYTSGDGATPHQPRPEGSHLWVWPQFQPPRQVEIRRGQGGHGGGDPVLLTDIFASNPPKDPLLRAAGFAEGAWSILTGAAANRSIKTGRTVRVDAMVKGVPEPNFPKMPTD
jgi:predicted dehydrogenase